MWLLGKMLGSTGRVSVTVKKSALQTILCALLLCRVETLAEGSIDGSLKVCHNVNLLQDPIFERLHSSSADSIDDLLEDNLLGWWADGKRAFTAENHTLEVKCAEKALALYQYLPLNLQKVYGEIKGLEVSFSATYELVEKSSKNQGFHGVRIMLQDTEGSLWRTLDFNRGGAIKELLTLDVPIQAGIVVIACTGFSGKMHISDLRIAPVVYKNAPCGFQFRSQLSSVLCLRKPIQQVVPGLTFHHAWHARSQFQPTVALATHLTPDRIDSVVNVIVAWGCLNPASITMFVPAPEAYDAEMRLKSGLIKQGCHPSDLTNIDLIVVTRPTGFSSYPVNVLRNLAWTSATARFVFLVDADIVPSPDAHTRISNHMATLEEKASTAYVVPVFESNGPQVLQTKSKRKLLALYERGRVAQ